MKQNNDGTEKNILPHKVEVVCERCFSAKRSQLYPNLPNVVRCDKCGYIYTFPQPSWEALQQFYDEAYFKSSRSVTKGYDNYFKDENNIKKTFERRFRQFIEPLGITNGKVLDIGSAAGFFLDVMKAHGWETVGVEISDFCTRHSNKKGHAIFGGHLRDFARDRGEEFDVVTMWDCLEHVQSPRETLLLANQMMKPGGYLLIATPAADSWVAHLFKQNWIGFKEWEHLHFFGIKDFRTFLNDYGFRVKKSCFVGKYVSYDLFKRRLAQYNRPLSRFVRKYLSGPPTKDLSFYLNPLDIRLVIARKKYRVL